MSLSEKEILKLRSDYAHCGSYTQVWRENRENMPTLRSGSHVSYYVNRPESITTSKLKFSPEIPEDFFWLGYLHKCKPSITKRFFSIKEFVQPLNEWYFERTGQEIYSNRISAESVISELNRIVRSGVDSYLSKLPNKHRLSFIRGLYYGLEKNIKKEILIIEDVSGYLHEILESLKPKIIYEKKENTYILKYKNIDVLLNYVKRKS